MVTLYVEGGGDATGAALPQYQMALYVEGDGEPKEDLQGYPKDLISQCRRGFREFITNAGIAAPTDILRIVPCGGRGSAYKGFCRAIEEGENAMLLVDSEEPVSPQHQTDKDISKWQPWDHLKCRDRWNRPNGSNDTDCHLMVQIMETWFLTDPGNLQEFFGAGFNSYSLPSETDSIESIRKGRVFTLLKEASQGSTRKGTYKKGTHSFQLLSKICPAKVMRRSPWARRFTDALKKKMASAAC